MACSSQPAAGGPLSRGAHDDRGCQTVAEQPRGRGQPALRIEHHACRARSNDVARGQPGRVRQCRPDADEHGVAQRADPMEVHQALGSIDVAGIATASRDVAIQALAEHGDDATAPTIAEGMREMEIHKRETWGIGLHTQPVDAPPLRIDE